MFAVINRSTLSGASIFFTLLFICFALSLTANAQQTTTAAQATERSARLPVDSAIEDRLDRLLNNVANPEKQLEELNAIKAELTASTPIMTQVRVGSYVALSYAYLDETDRAYKKLDEMEQLARQIEFSDALAEVNATRMMIKLFENKLTEAYMLINQVAVPLENAQSPRIRYFAHNLIASVYSDKNQPERALEHLIEAMLAVDETDDSRTHIRRLHIKLRIAAIHESQQRYNEALRHIAEAKEQATTYGIQDDFLPEILFQQAIVETSRGNLDEALELYQELEQTIRGDEDWIYLYTTTLNNMGDLDIRTGRYEAGIDVLNKAMAIAEQQGDTISQDLIRFNLGFIDVHLEKYDQGLAAMQEVVNKARSQWIDSEFEGLLGEYAEALMMAGRYREATDALLEQRKLREDVYNVELQKNVTELQNLYDSKDKAQQIELLQQQNDLKQQLLENEQQRQLILTLFVVVALLGAVLVGFLYRAARRSNLALKDANEKLADQSVRDPLTGLLNRRAMQQELELQKNDERHSPRSDAMILLDIDNFKRINDNFGHGSGDEVLIEVAKRLRKVSRDSDKIIRWGGEEFLIYLSNADHGALPKLTERVLQIIGSTPVQAGDKTIKVTATAGFISFPFADLNNTEMDWEETLQLVDMALYAGKVHGRNQAWGVMELNVPFEQARRTLETDLPKAIENEIISVTTIHGPKQD